MSEQVRKALIQLYILAGLGLVLLAVVWVAGWFIAPLGLYEGKDDPGLLLLLTTLVLGAWNLLSCVIAAGFFHAASRNGAKTFRHFKNASLRLVFIGVLFLFPVPLMTHVLGGEIEGRALALFVIVISMAGIAFGRARIRMIGNRLAELEHLAEAQTLAPFEEPQT